MFRNCKFCNKELHRIKLPGGLLSGLPICECEEKKLEQEQEKAKLNLLQYEFQMNLKTSGIGERFINCSFDNYDVNSFNKESFTKCKLYSDHFNKYLKSGYGLLLAGEPGNGKTHLATAIFKEVLKRQYTTIFIFIPEFLSLFKNYKNNVKNYDLCNCDLLIMDDIGLKDLKDFNFQEIFVILNTRYRRKKPTIITTNELEALKNYDHGKFFDRVRDCSKIIINNDKSKRG